MYKQGIFTIEENRPLTASVYRMVLEGDTRYITAPGQFINIALEGKFLRRPISVCDYDSQTVTIIYKVVGQGTAQMAKMQPGRRWMCLLAWAMATPSSLCTIRCSSAVVWACRPLQSVQVLAGCRAAGDGDLRL